MKRYTIWFIVIASVLLISQPLLAGTILVTSHVTDDILEYDSDTGDYLRTFANTGDLTGPIDLIVSPYSNNVLVTCELIDSILEYDISTGDYVGVFASGNGLSRPTRMTYGPNGNLYVTSRYTDEVIQYNGATGALVGSFAGGGGLRRPQGLIFDNNGDLLVASRNTNNVLKYDGDTGAYLSVFADAGGIGNPSSILFNEEGNLLVISVYSDSILEYDSDGNFLGVFLSGIELGQPSGMAFGPNGNLFVGSYTFKSILEYDASTGDFVGTFIFGNELDYPAGFVFVPEPEPTTVPVTLDIKPTSCPNPLNTKSKGVLPVAILGSEEFDVSTIVPTSVRLNGVEPIRDSLEDVSTPLTDPNECECSTDGSDGFTDLTLKFDTQQIVESLGEVNTGDVLTLPLTGVLNDETPIEGADCVVIVGRHKPLNKGDINKDGLVNMTDILLIAENWLQSSIVE